jgi:hypothetical protein
LGATGEPGKTAVVETGLNVWGDAGCSSGGEPPVRAWNTDFDAFRHFTDWCVHPLVIRPIDRIHSAASVRILQ